MEGRQAKAGSGARARAIFLMFWAAAASRHWQATASRPEARVAVAVKLLGVGEGAFDGLFPAFVDALAPRG